MKAWRTPSPLSSPRQYNSGQPSYGQSAHCVCIGQSRAHEPEEPRPVHDPLARLPDHQLVGK